MIMLAFHLVIRNRVFAIRDISIFFNIYKYEKKILPSVQRDLDLDPNFFSEIYNY